MIYGKDKLTGEPMVTIYMGEHFVSTKKEVICTLLGSCIAVCLYDESKAIGGMNHFMLPGYLTSADNLTNNPNQYGIDSIKNLINRMLNLGVTRNNVVAKIFGGANVLNSNIKNTSGNANIKLAKILLEYEDIKIVGEDIGGIQARKIYFHTSNGKVFVKSKIPSNKKNLV